MRPFNIEKKHSAHVPLKKLYMGFCIEVIFWIANSVCLQLSEIQPVSAWQNAFLLENIVERARWCVH